MEAYSGSSIATFDEAVQFASAPPTYAETEQVYRFTSPNGQLASGSKFIIKFKPWSARVYL